MSESCGDNFSRLTEEPMPALPVGVVIVDNHPIIHKAGSKVLPHLPMKIYTRCKQEDFYQNDNYPQIKVL
ncbi:MAG: hypothetical protein ACLFSB_07380 [Chitinispirillaceae bacterium]